MSLLNIAIVAALAATVLALLMGLVSMAVGGNFDARYANLFMRLRVAIQGVAITLVGLALVAGAVDWFGNG